MSADLERYTKDLEQRATSLSKLSDEELKRYAAKAASERDTEALWSLTEAYIVTKGRKKAKTAASTLEAYKRGVQRLVKVWSDESILRPSRDAGDRYVTALQVGRGGEKPLDAGTIQVRLAAARALYKALRWSGATSATPFDDVAAPPQATAPEERRTAYTDEQIEKLYRASGDLDAVIVTLGAEAGLRVSEMLDLTWSDIDLEAQRLNVRAGKGSKRRTVRLPPNTVDALASWKLRNAGQPHEHVLPVRTASGVRYRLKVICRTAGVAYLGIHSLRHHCGTWLYRTSKDLNVARKHLGHADISTTTIYAKMDDSTLVEALQRRRRILRTDAAAA